MPLEDKNTAGFDIKLVTIRSRLKNDSESRQTGTAPSLGLARFPVRPKFAPYRPINLQGRLKTKTAFQTASLTDFIMQPTLDVIIPCYNAANTLRVAAESALAQSVVQTVWLVDDASDDGTPDIMRELAAQYPQIRCEYLPSNGGNWGALQSQADFTAFLDADDAYEVSALLPAYTALNRYTYLSLVRLKLRPAGFPDRYLTHPNFNRAWQQLEMTVGGNTVFRRNTLLACGGFPQDEIFRTFGGEDAALGIALTRSSVVGTLFGEQDAAVRHTYRPNIHAERLLELALFGISDQKITTKHFQQAEAVTERICRKLEELKLQIALEQNGIMPLLTSYAD